MENRSEIVSELFELRVLLNKANLVANQKSELIFDLVESKSYSKSKQFICLLKGVNNSSFVVLAEQMGTTAWREPSISRFYYLEGFCASELERIQTTVGLKMKSYHKLRDTLLNHMNNQLRSLGIQKSE